MNPCFIDSHLHLQDDRFGGKAELLIKNAQKAGVALFLCNAVKESDWPVIADLRKNNDGLIPFLGIHPWYAGTAIPGWDARLKAMLESLNQSCGVGESGLDRTAASDFTVQINLFEKHLEIARQLSRPIALHCVRSWGVLVDRLESCAGDNTLPATMIHSFSGSYETMKRLTRIGCFISFSMQIIEPHMTKLREIFIRTPLERLLLETDAPARLNPSAFRQATTLSPFSEPVLIPQFYRWAARQRNIEPGYLKTQIWSNAQIYTNKTPGG